MSNLDQLIPGATSDPDSHKWATVTQESPLRVRLDGDSVELPLTPDELTKGLKVSQRVLVLLTTNESPNFRGRRAVVIGRAGGLALPKTSWTPTLFATSTNPTLGTDSVQTGRFWRDDASKRIWGDGVIRFGTSGTVAGTGSYYVALPTAVDPFTEDSLGFGDILGTFTIRDNSNLSASRTGVLSLFSDNGGPGGVATAYLDLLSGTIPRVDQANPFAWTVQDAIAFHFDCMMP